MPGMSPGELDLQAVLKRRDAFTHNHDDSGQVNWAANNGIDVIRGRGRLVAEKSVEVVESDGSTRTIAARHAVVIATGTTASVPPIEGLREAHPWTSRDVTNLREVPGRVAVIGGGVVACESATWLSGLGAREVTVIEPEPRLLAQQEPFVGALIAEQFEQRGIRVRVDTGVDSVSRPAAQDTGVGRIHGGPVTVSAGGTRFEVDEVVVAAGRTPATRELGLGAIGVDVSQSHGYLQTDDHMAVKDGPD